MASIIQILEENKVVVISKKNCSYCVKLKALLLKKVIEYSCIEIESFMSTFDDDNSVLDDIDTLKGKWGITSYPMFFINNIHIGDYGPINKMNVFDECDKVLNDNKVSFSDNKDDF